MIYPYHLLQRQLRPRGEIQMQKANPLPELCAVPILVLVIYDDDDHHHDHPDVNDDENVVYMSCNEDPTKEGQSITSLRNLLCAVKSWR